jgi:hypothetical protein
MVIIQSTAIAIAMRIIAMFCWGQWANTQKLASKEWRFQLYYWDFAIGVLLLALVVGVITTYFSTRVGSISVLAVGVGFVVVAIILDALAYRRLADKCNLSFKPKFL